MGRAATSFSSDAAAPLMKQARLPDNLIIGQTTRLDNLARQLCSVYTPDKQFRPYQSLVTLLWVL